jgi:hypothetical protein
MRKHAWPDSQTGLNITGGKTPENAGLTHLHFSFSTALKCPPAMQHIRCIALPSFTHANLNGNAALMPKPYSGEVHVGFYSHRRFLARDGSARRREAS